VKRLLALILILLAGCQSAPLKSKPMGPLGFEAYLKTIEVEIGTSNGKKIEENYFLYIGTEESELADEFLAFNHVIGSILLIHPIKGDDRLDFGFEAEKRWYAWVVDNIDQVSMIAPLLVPDVWNSIPPILKHVLNALDLNDNDLILIDLNMRSGSISIWFAPKYSTDKNFHLRKLNRLIKYLDSHDVYEEIYLSVINAMYI
jgi:hypothetical protein